jgi:hypothetical protein
MTRYHLPRQPGHEPPVLLGRLWGWRAFKLGAETVSSPQQRHSWKSHSQQAECYAGHVSPGDSCSCGFYVYATLEDLMDNIDLYGTKNVGLVSAWGKIVLAEYGFRAQWVRLEHLFLDADRNWRAAVGAHYDTLEHQVRVAHLAKLPVIDLPQKFKKRVKLDKMVIPRREVPSEVIEEFMGNGSLTPRVAKKLERRAKARLRPPPRQFPYSHHVASRHCAECDGNTPWNMHVSVTGDPISCHTEYRCSICGTAA